MKRSLANPEVAARSPGDAPERGGRSAGQGAPVQRSTPTAIARPDADGPISATTMARLQAAVTALAPAVVSAGLLYHPHIGTPSEPDFLAMLAAAIAADPGRWAISHLLVGIGSGLLILAFLAIRSHLRAAGEQVWSVLALPFVVMGSVLFALLPAMEFAPLAAAEAGVDIQAVQAALLPRFVPILQTAAVVFAVGALGFAMGIARSGLLSPALTWLTAGALTEWRPRASYPWSLPSCSSDRQRGSWRSGRSPTGCGGTLRHDPHRASDERRIELRRDRQRRPWSGELIAHTCPCPPLHLAIGSIPTLEAS